jgi:hypothetical protein
MNIWESPDNLPDSWHERDYGSSNSSYPSLRIALLVPSLAGTHLFRRSASQPSPCRRSVKRYRPTGDQWDEANCQLPTSSLPIRAGAHLFDAPRRHHQPSPCRGAAKDTIPPESLFTFNCQLPCQLIALPRSRRSARERTSFDAPRRRHQPTLPQERQKIPSHRRPVRRGKLPTSPLPLPTSLTANFFTVHYPLSTSTPPHSPPNRGRIHSLNALYPSREGIYPPSDFERA